MNTTTCARDGLHRWRGMDAGHRGRAVAIEVGMQIGIQVLFAGLVIFTLVMALVLSPPRLGRILGWAALLIVVYTALMGTHVMSRSRREMWRPLLVAAMVVVSILLAIDFPYAAYLTIPLSFVYLDHLPPLQACVAVVVGAVAILLGVGLTGGWSGGDRRPSRGCRCGSRRRFVSQGHAGSGVRVGTSQCGLAGGTKEVG
ncbi:hypothetical protein CUAC110533_07685 [Cutibacterium acnes subsp. elongatum]